MKTSRVKVAGFIADRTLSGGINDKLAREVAAYLLVNNRVSDLDSILRDVQQDWADNGYVEVVATSSHPFTDEVRMLIENEVKRVYPSAKKIIITPVYDQEIIGGVRLNFASRQLDLTIKTKLNKFRQLAAERKG